MVVSIRKGVYAGWYYHNWKAILYRVIDSTMAENASMVDNEPSATDSE